MARVLDRVSVAASVKSGGGVTPNALNTCEGVMPIGNVVGAKLQMVPGAGTAPPGLHWPGTALMSWVLPAVKVRPKGPTCAIDPGSRPLPVPGLKLKIVPPGDTLAAVSAGRFAVLGTPSAAPLKNALLLLPNTLGSKFGLRTLPFRKLVTAPPLLWRKLR